MSKLAEEINERLIGEYISKVRCCDECFASVYCTVNGLRESRVPQEYCVKNIKRYFGDKAKPVEERKHEKWEHLKEHITDMRDADGTANQKDTCQFILNLMGVIEREGEASDTNSDNR